MTPAPLNPVAHSLRIALAVTCCLFAAVCLDLRFANLAVYSTYMVLVQFPVTIFQRGLERLGGRLAGVVVGLILSAILPDWPGMVLAFEFLILWVVFYVYQSGHLAYTFLNIGLYLVVMVEISHAHPQEATTLAVEMLSAIGLGVLVAFLVAWLTGAESGLQVDPSGQPIWPIRLDWASKGMTTATTVLLLQALTRWLELNTEPTVIAVVILMVQPDVAGMVSKGELRIIGALLASAWALLAFALLAFVPRLVILIVLQALGVYMAAYLARTVPNYAYAGVQMGMVIPMLIIVPPSQFGEINVALVRVGAALLAIVAGVVVAELWPWQPRAPAT